MLNKLKKLFLTFVISSIFLFINFGIFQAIVMASEITKEDCELFKSLNTEEQYKECEKILEIKEPEIIKEPELIKETEKEITESTMTEKK